MKAILVLPFILVALACSKPTLTPQQSLEGQDCAHAIRVKTVADEYAWMKARYPGFLPKGQSLLMSCNGINQPIDAVTILLRDGTTRTFYFTGFSMSY
jgi:hypothetical protein